MTDLGDANRRVNMELRFAMLASPQPQRQLFENVFFGMHPKKELIE
jgi:hypothetical protein